ncbi:MAG: TIGR01620 family protein [Pseudomonadota bacterium]
MPKPTVIELSKDPKSAFDVDPIIDTDVVLPDRSHLRRKQRQRPYRSLVWGAFVALVVLVMADAVWRFISTLLAGEPLLGWFAAGCASIVALGIALFLLRELTALTRMRRVDRIRAVAEQNWELADRNTAVAFRESLAQFYRMEDATLRSKRDVDPDLKEALTGADVISLTEQAFLGQRDSDAQKILRSSARQVATITAFVPLALVDVLGALVVNIRMVRQIAEVYGARSSLLASVRLIRAIAAHLMATGALALGDDLISSVAGGSVLSKLSRRFGEGLVNGALTVRVGIAAMDVCRPMPFRALEKPRTRPEVTAALAGIFGKE